MHVLLLMFSLGVGGAYAEGPDFESAKKIVMTGNEKGAVACMACHQANGAGNAAAGFPQLAGLNADYFSKQILDYQNLTRINPVMQPIAKGLSESEIKALANYFASLTAVPNEKANLDKLSAKDRKSFELGRRIAESGLWDKGMPACYACHGPSGGGVGSSFPAINNQGKTYLVQQLQAWKKGDRKNDPNQLMASVAKKMTPQEIQAVAEFLSSGLTEAQK